MVAGLGVAAPDLGVHTAGDSAALNARRTKKFPADVSVTPQAAAATPTATVAATAPTPPTVADATPAPPSSNAQPTPTTDEPKVVVDNFGLPVPAAGRKEYTDDAGKVVKVVSWFVSCWRCHF
jgi:hypothetical protein